MGVFLDLVLVSISSISIALKRKLTMLPSPFTPQLLKRCLTKLFFFPFVIGFCLRIANFFFSVLVQLDFYFLKAMANLLFDFKDLSSSLFCSRV